MQKAQFEVNDRVEQVHWWFTARRAILGDLLRRLVAPGATVVDLGCGTGGNLAAWSGSYRCLGWDPSEQAIGFARQRYPDLDLRCGNDLPVDYLAQADLVLLTDVLEHVADDRGMVEKACAATRPGTSFLLTVPAHQWLWSPQDEVHGHHRRYEPEDWRALWQGLPVEWRMTSFFNSRLFLVIRLIRICTRLLGRGAGAAGTDVWVPREPLNGLLRQVFRGEGRVLVELLEGRRSKGYSQGVSLISVLRRRSG